MKKTKLVLTIIVAVAATGLMTPALANAASQPSLLQEKGKPEKGEPFNGKVEAVNAEAKTLTVGGAAILVTDTTKLTKLGKPITLADIKVGDHVHGKTSKNAEGKAEALNITVGGEKGGEKK